MEFDFSQTLKPTATAAVALQTVYVLHADPSYDVTKKESGRKGYVALRTLEGAGRIFIEGTKPKTVTADTLIFFEYPKVKRYYCESEHWDFWWFEFTMNGLSTLPLNRILKLDVLENEVPECRRCLESLRKNNTESDGFASAVFSLLLYRWMLHLKTGRDRRNPHQDAINKVVEYMHENLGENISVAFMARQAGLSERRFRQVFRDITGKQPKEFYDTIRMNMAEGLILNTSMPLGDIAARPGYSSQFHFSREFKKFYGFSPAEFQRGQKCKNSET